MVSAKFTGEVTPLVLLLWFSSRLCRCLFGAVVNPVHVYYQENTEANLEATRGFSIAVLVSNTLHQIVLAKLWQSQTHKFAKGENLNAIIANLSRASYISIAKDRPVHYNS